jgi:hypothetical protein
MIFLQQIGSQGSAPDQYDTIAGFGLDRDGNVMVPDLWNNRILIYSNDGLFVRAWGDSGSGPGQFRVPIDAIMIRGEIFVSDAGNHRIQVFDDSLRYLRSVPVASAAFIAGDEGTGAVYTNGWPNITRIADGTAEVSWQFGQTLPPSLGFGCSPAGDVFVTDGSEIVRYQSDGAEIVRWGGLGDVEGRFHGATAVAVDAMSRVLVADGAGRVQVFSDSGAFLCQWGKSGYGPAEISDGARDMAIDSQGNVFLLNADRILKFGRDPSPAKRTTWGQVKSHYR